MIKSNTLLVEKISRILIKRGEKLYKKPFRKIVFTGDEQADNLLNNLVKYPHAFVLACIMDRQIKAERAWKIPFVICNAIGGFAFKELLKLRLKEIKYIFRKNRLHRFNETMAVYFYEGIRHIHNNFFDNAANIWNDIPSSATMVRRFLEFNGIGIKIASMAVNILVRHFKIRTKDKINIDISPDVQVKKVFKRLGLISNDSSNDNLIYRARELYPKYPGIFDYSAWEIGRNWCKKYKPICQSCYLEKYCPKLI